MLIAKQNGKQQFLLIVVWHFDWSNIKSRKNLVTPKPPKPNCHETMASYKLLPIKHLKVLQNYISIKVK